ncbi:hypothetical protein [Pedobacter frigoris]|uniref:hypothetical protein n=1 Tax=Pedobacter frigoris TaxID=2571272 RepID=UPI00292F527A|nr:hypothetical protein [Pedobacter frigoris]
MSKKRKQSLNALCTTINNYWMQKRATREIRHPKISKRVWHRSLAVDAPSGITPMTFKTESEARTFLAKVKANQDGIRKAGYNITEMYGSLSRKLDNKIGAAPNTRSDIGDGEGEEAPNESTAIKLVFSASKPLEPGVYLKLTVEYNKKTKAYISRSFSIFGSTVSCSFTQNETWVASLSTDNSLACSATGYYSSYVTGVGMMMIDSYQVVVGGRTTTFNITLTPLR